jgi:glycosyltransferase involved in cell wall biosynthesis
MSASPLPRVVLLVDRPGWAFDIIASALSERLSHRFDFRILRREVEPVDLDPREVDLLYAFWWGDRSFAHLGFPAEKVVRDVASHRWMEESHGRLSPRALAEVHLSDCATVTTPSRRLFQLLRPHHPRVFHVPSGVDARLFRPRLRRAGRLRVAWVGNPRDATKGLHDVIEPACAGRFELLQSSGRQTQRELVSLYQRADVIAVGSLAEGQPLPLMEGMACGCFPVATDVGIVPELVRDRVNGLVVERRVEAFREAFAWCESQLAYVRRAGRFDAALVALERSWDALAPRFGDVLDAALGRAPAPAAEVAPPENPLRASLTRGCVPARLAFLTPELATPEAPTGGLGNYIARMTSALADAGHEAEIFVTAACAPARGDTPGVVVHRIGPALERRAVRAALRVLGLLRLRRIAHVLPPLVDAWALAAALRRSAARAPFDLVQSACAGGVGLFVRRSRGALHVIRCSHDEREIARQSGQPLLERAALDWMMRLAMRRADRLYAPSRFLAEHLERQGLQVRVVPPPAFLEVEPAAPPRGLPPKYFVHFGQLMPVKGTPQVAEALVRVLAEEPEFALVFAGRDRMGRFEEWRRAWGPHAARVRWLGELPKRELYAVVAGADAAVLPSRFDNLPNTVMESLLLGVPVIGTAGASIDELVTPGVAGVLVPDGDVAALADAMLAQWRGETGIRRGFTWERGPLRADVAVARLLELGGLGAP